MQGGREISVGVTIFALAVALAATVPQYFAHGNLTDLFLTNVPVLLIALGMTLVILTGEIDISVGSVFAVASVLAGIIAKSGAPALVALLSACLAGAALGTMNGVLVAYLRIPSIVVTLAAMVALRDALRWSTQGAWIGNLPPNFQWMGLSQSSYPAVMLVLALALSIILSWVLKNVGAGRGIYATGSNEESARLAGLKTRGIKVSVFAVLGALTGIAAVLNSARFSQIPTNTGLGLELKVIAAVVIGGAAVTGGSGTVLGTVLGVVLMAAIGPALTFWGISAYWDKAIQGLIILVAITVGTIRARTPEGVRFGAAEHA
jgi:rhamnose transport system permease protein